MKEPNSKCFQQLDDVQLWRVSDGLRSIPIFCDPGRCYQHSIMRVKPAMPMNRDQWNFMDSCLDSRCISKELECWFYHRNVLGEVAIKCNGITPSYYMKWEEGGVIKVREDGSPDPDRISATGPQSPSSRFVHEACNYMGIGRVDVAISHWSLLCRYAWLWTVVLGRPLELGWCRIRAFPYRNNWAPWMVSRFPRLRSTLRDNDTKRGREVRRQIGFDDALYDPRMLAVEDNNTIRWSLAIDPRPDFHKCCKVMESQERAESGEVGYLKRVTELIKRRKDEIIEHIASYMEEASTPDGWVDDDIPPNRRRLRRGVSDRYGYKAATDHPRVSVVVDSQPDDHNPFGEEITDDSQTPKRLPQLPS